MSTGGRHRRPTDTTERSRRRGLLAVVLGVVLLAVSLPALTGALGLGNRPEVATTVGAGGATSPPPAGSGSAPAPSSTPASPSRSTRGSHPGSAMNASTASTPATGTPTGSSSRSSRPGGPSATSPDVGPGTAAGPVAGAGEQRDDAPAPTTLNIIDIDVSAPVVPLDLRADGTLEVPADPWAAGWYARGPAPGERGAAVVVGHLDSRTGPALFARLEHLKLGAEILVSSTDGSVQQFTVYDRATFRKDDFPRERVYGPVPGSELRLVTCSGRFDRDRGGYQDNYVVFAKRS